VSRDPERIPRILEVLRQRWELEPDLRLCQLIVNATGRTAPEVFYVEDEELEAALLKSEQSSTAN
jgi:uncharacterized protein YihD (DUF1040 family)